MKQFLLTLALAGIGGCSSIRTQAIDRVENDTIVVNPEQPLKGVPVSLRIPTHLELSVIETTYWEKQDIPGKKPTLVPLSTCRPTRTVTYQIKETEKIFLVDPVRPGAGTQMYGFEFQKSAEGKTDKTGKGYLSGVKYKADDQTITESASLLSKSLGFIQALQTSANPEQVNTSALITTDRTIAFARFDINSPSYECDVELFLNQYVNNCPAKHSFCPTVCEPDRCNTSREESLPMPRPAP